MHPIHSHRSQVIQGSFLGGRFRAPVVPSRQGAVQASPRGDSVLLPSALQLGRTGSGQRLPEAVQRKMEALFQADFSDVRVHVGPEASAIGALAFTHGPDIYFAPGQYAPGSPHGLRLLGHELTHVVQQRVGRVRNPFGSGVAVVQDPALEAEAERMGTRTAVAQAHPAPGQALAAQPRAGRPAAPAAPGTVQPFWPYVALGALALIDWWEGFPTLKSFYRAGERRPKNRLIVGCGEARAAVAGGGHAPHAADQSTMDIDRTMRPDYLADICGDVSWYLDDGVFTEVFFERFPFPAIDRRSLRNVHRLLRAGGTVRIDTGASIDYDDDAERIRQDLANTGFRNINLQSGRDAIGPFIRGTAQK